MKLIYLGTAIAMANGIPTTPYYMQSNVVERDRVEVIYLPNNTCHVSAPIPIPANNYKDYVRACLNNRHLRQVIN